MTETPSTASDLIALWGSAEKFSRAIGLKHTSHGRAMRSRGTINERWWDTIVLDASRRGIDGITHSVLAKINERHAEQVAARRLVMSQSCEVAA